MTKLADLLAKSKSKKVEADAAAKPVEGRNVPDVEQVTPKSNSLANATNKVNEAGKDHKIIVSEPEPATKPDLKPDGRPAQSQPKANPFAKLSANRSNALANLKKANTAPKVAKPDLSKYEEPEPTMEIKAPPSVEEIASQQIDLSDSEFNNSTQPDGYTEEEATDFRNLFDYLAQHITDPMVVGNATKEIISKLRNNLFLREILREEDIGMMVRGLREAYGVEINKKTAKRAKNTKAEEDAAMMMELLGGAG